MKHSYTGFSLIELLVTLAVIAIGLAMTVPAMRDFTNSNRQTVQINKLVRDISYAKSEASTRGSSATISQLGGTAGNWYEGWQVASDTSVLRTTPALTTPSITLQEKNNITAVRFRASGRIRSKVNFELCDPKNTISNTEKQVNISVTGHVSVDTKYNC